jgi:hypothetical protein
MSGRILPPVLNALAAPLPLVRMPVKNKGLIISKYAA